MDKAEDGIQPKRDEENQKEGEGSECGLEYGGDGKELHHRTPSSSMKHGCCHPTSSMRPWLARIQSSSMSTSSQISHQI
jgi:hypothetical protein